jgi:hypothetical protein
MVETRAKYVAHIEKMLQLIGLQMQLKVLLKLWLETVLATNHMKKK